MISILVGVICLLFGYRLGSGNGYEDGYSKGLEKGYQTAKKEQENL